MPRQRKTVGWASPTTPQGTALPHGTLRANARLIRAPSASTGCPTPCRTHTRHLRVVHLVGNSPCRTAPGGPAGRDPQHSPRAPPTERKGRADASGYERSAGKRPIRPCYACRRERSKEMLRGLKKTGCCGGPSPPYETYQGMSLICQMRRRSRPVARSPHWRRERAVQCGKTVARH